MPTQGPAVTGEEVLEVLRERDREQYPVMTTTDVAEHFDVTRRTINTRLRELHEAGRIQRHEPGGTPVWYPADEQMVSITPGTTPSSNDESTAHDQMTDGAVPAEQRNETVRNRVLEIVDDFEEDLTRVSHQALTLAKMDVEKHFKRLFMTGAATVITFALVLLHIAFDILPDWLFQWGAVAFFVALSFLAIAVGSAAYSYQHAGREARDEMALAQDEGQPNRR